MYEHGQRLEWDLRRNRKELFDSDTDVFEVKNVARAKPDDVKKLAKRAEEVFGKPWVATADGEVAVTKGVVMHNGPKKRKKVKAGDAFQVLPYDAETRFTATDAEEAVGPWRRHLHLRRVAG